MFEYQVIVKGINLNSDDLAHVYLVDCLLSRELTDKLYEDDDVALSNADTYYIYLVKSNEEVWRLTLTECEVPDKPHCYKYKSVKKITLSDIKYLVSHELERHRVIKELLPIKIVPKQVSYYNEDLIRSRENN